MPIPTHILEFWIIRSLVYIEFVIEEGSAMASNKKSSLKQGASTAFGWKTGFEPATSGTTIQRSNQLSYNHRVIADANVIYFTSFAKKNSIFFKEYHLTRSHPTIALQ